MLQVFGMEFTNQKILRVFQGVLDELMTMDERGNVAKMLQTKADPGAIVGLRQTLADAQAQFQVLNKVNFNNQNY